MGGQGLDLIKRLRPQIKGLGPMIDGRLEPNTHLGAGFLAKALLGTLGKKVPEPGLMVCDL